MVLRFSATTLLTLLLLCSCNKGTQGSGPHATVYLRDGTAVSGRIISNSPSEIQIAADDNSTRTIPVSQVQSMTYDQAPAPQTAAAPAPPPTGAPADSAPPPDAVHDQHYHPEQSAITTQTYDLAAGTQITVRNEETINSERAVEGQTFPAEVTHDVHDAAGGCVAKFDQSGCEIDRERRAATLIVYHGNLRTG